VLHPNRMDPEIASAINQGHFHQQALAHRRMMNARRNGKGTITPITHQNATAEMAKRYSDIIITAAWTVNKGVVDVKENKTWKRLKIHAVSLVWYMGKGTDGLQQMREESEAEKVRIAIPAQVRWLANPGTITERRKNGELACVIGCLYRKEEQGRTECTKERHEGSRSVVLS